MRDNNAPMNAEQLLTHLRERSKRLAQMIHGSKTQDFPVPGNFPELFPGSKALSENEKVANFPVSRFARGDTCARPRDARVGAPAGAHTHVFNSIFTGKKEKEEGKPRETTDLGFSKTGKLPGNVREMPENVPACCICKQPIETPVDTWWGADPAHRPCAEAAFQANKAAGRYRP